ncbi:MAG: hypothetical protein IPJ88_18660 [Myxococcales bacterium]|nr:MAG: hypothetical protein IPJ88_18660 [Myxococcales bacterium]
MTKNYRRKTPQELLQSLQALDQALRKDQTLIIIGGAVLVLGYGVTKGTTDIDTYESMNSEIKEALKTIREKMRHSFLWARPVWHSFHTIIKSAYNVASFLS